MLTSERNGQSLARRLPASTVPAARSGGGNAEPPSAGAGATGERQTRESMGVPRNPGTRLCRILLQSIVSTACRRGATLTLHIIILLSACCLGVSNAAGSNRDEQIECLALNIYFEARGEPELGEFAVGHVVMNRLLTHRFANDVCNVVYQQGVGAGLDCQFSWTCDGLSDKPANQKALRRARAIARQIYFGLSEDPTNGALWYHADYAEPDWASFLGPGRRIGRHIFYRGHEARSRLRPASGMWHATLQRKPVIPKTMAESPLPLVTRTFLQQLTMTVHVYSPDTGTRVVRINQALHHEGDSLQPGLRLESITPDGIVLRYQDRWFRMPFPNNDS